MELYIMIEYIKEKCNIEEEQLSGQLFRLFLFVSFSYSEHNS